VNGFLPASEDEWFERTCQLVEDPELRLRLGRVGRQTVVEHYSVSHWKGPLLQVLRRTATGQDAPYLRPGVPPTDQPRAKESSVDSLTHLDHVWP
jgi:hypothetical protein